MTDVWDQLEDETEEEFVKFLIYKNLGFDRSIDKAYNSYLATNITSGGESNKKAQLLGFLLEEKKPAPGSWYQLASKRFWKKRAELWDISELRKTEKSTFIKQVAIIKAFAEKIEEALKDPKIKPKNFFQLLQAIDVFNRRYTPELARAVLLGDESDQQQEDQREKPTEVS